MNDFQNINARFQNGALILPEDVTNALKASGSEHLCISILPSATKKESERTIEEIMIVQKSERGIVESMLKAENAFAGNNFWERVALILGENK